MTALKAAGIAFGVYCVAVVVCLVIMVVGVGMSSHMSAARAGRLLMTLIGVHLAVFAVAAVGLGLALRAAGIAGGGTALTLVVYTLTALATEATITFVMMVLLNR